MIGSVGNSGYLTPLELPLTTITINFVGSYSTINFVGSYLTVNFVGSYLSINFVGSYGTMNFVGRYSEALDRNNRKPSEPWFSS